MGEGVAYYLIDALNPTGYAKAIEEKATISGDPTRSYILGQDVIGRADAGQEVIYLVRDGHGTTRTVADEDGVVLEQYDFDAYGNKARYVAGVDAGTALTGNPMSAWPMDTEILGRAWTARGCGMMHPGSVGCGRWMTLNSATLMIH